MLAAPVSSVFAWPWLVALLRVWLAAAAREAGRPRRDEIRMLRPCLAAPRRTGSLVACFLKDGLLASVLRRAAGEVPAPGAAKVVDGHGAAAGSGGLGSICSDGAGRAGGRAGIWKGSGQCLRTLVLHRCTRTITRQCGVICARAVRWRLPLSWNVTVGLAPVGNTRVVLHPHAGIDSNCFLSLLACKPLSRPHMVLWLWLRGRMTFTAPFVYHFISHVSFLSGLTHHKIGVTSCWSSYREWGRKTLKRIQRVINYDC